MRSGVLGASLSASLLQVVEVAFTGDTCIDFVDIEANAPVFTAKLLVMELTFLDDAVSREGAKAKGHMHIDDFVEHADKFQARCSWLILAALGCSWLLLSNRVSTERNRSVGTLYLAYCVA